MFAFESYKINALSTCLPQCLSEDYLELGLISEIGEIAGKLKRVIRDGEEIDKDDMAKEIGDVLWYAVVLSHVRGDVFDSDYINPDATKYTVHIRICHLLSSIEGYINKCECSSLEDIIEFIKNLSNYLGFSIQEIADLNNEKLKSRLKRDKINGHGDNR